MEFLKFALLLLVALFVQMCGTLGSPLSNEEDGDVWAVDKWQVYSPERALTIRLADLIKRSKAQQFHGLMGRSAGASQPVRLGRKRNKGDMFVGLMGRRSMSGDVEDEWKTEYY